SQKEENLRRFSKPTITPSFTEEFAQTNSVPIQVEVPSNPK
ncbi:1979_t:CDS:1, partial [Funneliformis mosseae]